MLTIYIKELKSYFKSFFGWLFLAVFAMLFGIFFSILNIKYGSAYISESIFSCILLIMFLMPLLTMRVMSEEKKLKTDQLLLTYPVKGINVILGKYFAVITILFLTCLYVSIAVLIMAIYGRIPVGDNISAIIGLFLFECLFCAIGFFFSSITEHQFVAAVLTYASYLLIYLLPSVAIILSQASRLTPSMSMLGKIGDFINKINILSPFDYMLNGMIKVTDFVYVISIIAILLFASYIVFAKNSITLSAVGRNRFFATGMGYLVIILAIVGINIGVKYIPEEYSQIDLTENHMYSLTFESKDMIKNLDDDIVLHCIGTKEVVDDYIVKYLKLYDKSSKISVEYHSTLDEPTFYRNYTDNDLPVGSVVVCKGEEYRIVNYNSMFETSYEFNEYSYMSEEVVTALDMEGQITGAIASFYGDNHYSVCNLTGHDEIPLSDNILNRFKKGNFSVRDINLLTMDSVPADCNLLIINGPAYDLSVNEIAKIDGYINNGGNVFMILPSDYSETPNFIGFINDLGLEVTDGTVLEKSFDKCYAQAPYYLLEDPLASEYTLNLTQGGRKLFFHETRGMTVKDVLPEGTSAEVIVESSADSYAKVLRENTLLAMEEGDQNGPFALGVVLEKNNNNSDKPAVVTLIGSRIFLTDDANAVSNANNELFFGCINDLLDISISSTIPSKPLDNFDFITYTTSVELLYGVCSIVIIPLMLVSAGIILIISRRKK